MDFGMDRGRRKGREQESNRCINLHGGTRKPPETIAAQGIAPAEKFGKLGFIAWRIPSLPVAQSPHRTETPDNLSHRISGALLPAHQWAG